MHLHRVNDVALFWSPRCGYKSLYWLFKGWGLPEPGTTMSEWESNPRLDGMTKLVLVREPWERFKSFWRIQSKEGWLRSDITPYDFIASFDVTNYRDHIIHHAMPQWSQASVLLTGDEEYFDIADFDRLAARLGELLGREYVKPTEIVYGRPPEQPQPDTWWHGSEFVIERPDNFETIYGDSEIMYARIFKNQTT